MFVPAARTSFLEPPTPPRMCCPPLSSSMWTWPRSPSYPPICEQCVPLTGLGKGEKVRGALGRSYLRGSWVQVGGSSCFNSWPWVWAAGPHCSSWLMGEGVTCDGEGVLLCRCTWWLGEEGCWDLGRALGGKWYPPGTHNPKAALRVLVCTASSQTPENHVQKFTAWTVGAKRSLGLSHASD